MFFNLFKPPSVPTSAVVRRAILRNGWVRVGKNTFFSDHLLYLRDRLQRAARVDVAFDPSDLSVAWVFDPVRHVWIEVPNLYPQRDIPADAQAEAAVS